MTMPEFPYKDRNSWYWLFLSFVFGLMSFGSWAVVWASWLSMAFALRFVRTQPRWRAFFGTFAVSTAVIWIVGRGVIPIPGGWFYLFAAVQAVIGYIPLALDRWLYPRLQPYFASTLILPAIITGLEYLGSFGEYGVWGVLANTQYENLALMQLLSLTGLWGVTFLIVWFATTVNWVWEQNAEWSQIRRGVAIYACLLALVLFYGGLRMQWLEPKGEMVRIAAVNHPLIFDEGDELGRWFGQALFGDGLPEHELDAFRAYMEDGVERLLEATRMEAQAGARIVCWAEGNAVILQQDEAEYLQRLQTFSREHHVYLGASTVVLTPVEANRRGKMDNVIHFISPCGELMWTFHKAKPAPGEPIEPGDDTIPLVETMYGRLATVICYDADFPQFIRQASHADILFAPSNDWYEVRRLHRELASCRAIENGFNFVRPTSNGEAVITDYLGRTLALTNYFEAGPNTMAAYVPTQGVWTFYSIAGDWFAWICLLVFVGAIIAWRRQRATNDR